MSAKVVTTKRTKNHKIFIDLGDDKYCSENAIFEICRESGELTIYPNFGGQVRGGDLCAFQTYYNSPRGQTPVDPARVPYYQWDNHISSINKAYYEADKDINILENPTPPRRYTLLPKETLYLDTREKVAVAVEDVQQILNGTRKSVSLSKEQQDAQKRVNKVLRDLIDSQLAEEP